MEELYKEESTSEKILNEENKIFEHNDIIKGIESIFCFKDGDILVFKNTYSILYDGKSFKEKLRISFMGALCAFCYLSEEEFILLKDSYLSLYKFSNNRTQLKEICVIHKHNYENNKKIFVLSNNDLLNIYQVCINPLEYNIFRRIENNNEFVRYDLLSPALIEEIKDIEYVVNLDKDEFFTMKSFSNTDEILLKVYSNENYFIKRFNVIKCRINSKRRIYDSTLPLFKMKKKILIPSVCFFNIIDIETLELETTINISEEIKDIQIFDDSFIIFFECYRDFENLKRTFRFYLTKVWIDFETNNILRKESYKLNDESGEYKTLFKIFKYKENGLATLADQNYLKIYNKV